VSGTGDDATVNDNFNQIITLLDDIATKLDLHGLIKKA